MKGKYNATASTRKYLYHSISNWYVQRYLRSYIYYQDDIELTRKDNTMNLRINRNPGKFEGELVISEYVYELSLEGCDEEFNSADSWVGLLRGSIQVSATARLEMEMNADELFYLDRVVKGAIIEELSNGFVLVTYYEDSELLESDWQIRLTEAIIDEDDI